MTRLTASCGVNSSRAPSRRRLPRSGAAAIPSCGCANADNAMIPTGRDDAAKSRSAEGRLPLLGFVSVKGGFTRPACRASRPRKSAENRQSACKPGSVWREAVSRSARDGHSSGTIVADRLWRPTRATARRRACRLVADVSPLFGLAPGGACHARGVAVPAVRSYRTLSPLPLARRFAFCGAFPGVTPAGPYPAPCLRGARTFLCLAAAAIRPTGFSIDRQRTGRGQGKGA